MIETKFKHTDIGLVPVDWEVGHFSDIGEVCMCKRILKDQTTSKGDVPFYKIGTFGRAANAFIPMTLFLKYKNSYNYPSKGEILISAAGTIGRTVVFDGKPAYFQDSNIVWVDNNQTKILNTYLYYLCNVVKWQTEDGGIVNRLYNDNLRSTIITYPKSLAEQQRIASALMNIDALISNLDKLIAKKQAIKKGAMQELLTGKKRLPGFKGEWREIELGNIAEFLGGGTPSTLIAEYWKGNIPWISSSDLSENSITDVSITRHINKDAIKHSATTICPKNSIHLVARVGLGKLAITKEEICTSQDFCNIIINNPNYDVLFIALTLKELMQYKKEESQGTTIKGITIPEIKKISFKCPGASEQHAIAHVLSTMDSDISLLEQKRDKYRQIKQGMMRDLLTGRIRLIDKDSVERKSYTVGLQDRPFDGAIAAEPSPQ